MLPYIPDKLYKDINNKKRVEEILRSVPNTCLQFSGEKTPEEAIKEIRELGETELADTIRWDF